jgi:hypothetical protein
MNKTGFKKKKKPQINIETERLIKDNSNSES